VLMYSLEPVRYEIVSLVGTRVAQQDPLRKCPALSCIVWGPRSMPGSPMTCNAMTGVPGPPPQNARTTPIAPPAQSTV